MFSSRIEVVLPVEERCLDEIVRNMLQHILFMNLFKNDDDSVGSVDFLNMIEFRPVISSVAHLVELT